MTDWRYSCGDGTVQAPEECDRDQCCASCYAVPSDYACNDGNLCTHTDVCDASGASLPPPAAVVKGRGGWGVERNLTTSVLCGTAHLSCSPAFLFSAILWSLGNCAGTPYTCSDCKSCDGLGGCELSANICNIGGSCYPSFSDFKYNPSNSCEGKSGGLPGRRLLVYFLVRWEIVSPRNPFLMLRA